MNRRLAACALPAALGLLLQGCAQLPGTPPMVAQCAVPATGGDRPGAALVGQSYGMAMTPLPLNSVQFASHGVSTSLAVQALFATRTPADTVQISARFLSCLDGPAAVRVRTTFLRADTAPAESPSAWKVVHLEPRATALYTEKSVSRDAKSYLIEIAQ